jgi:AraC-like DNA-binding protein
MENQPLRISLPGGQSKIKRVANVATIEENANMVQEETIESFQSATLIANPLLADAPFITPEEVAKVVSQIVPKDGIFQTAIPFLSVIRSSQPTRRTPGIVKPSLCLVLQGGKRSFVGTETLYYDAGCFLVASLDMPMTGYVVDASPGKPYLGIKLTIDPIEVTAIMMEAQNSIPSFQRSTARAFVGRSTPELRDAIFRLLRLLGTPKDIPFIATAIKKEVIYRLLTSEYGLSLYQNLVADYSETGINKAIHLIKQQYATPLSIEALATAINMSVSGFHHKFKAVTTLSPLQYQKRLRLLEARRLLFTGTVDAATAAFTVGYESPSQFSREYRRLFGAPPLQDIENLRRASLQCLEQY